MFENEIKLLQEGGHEVEVCVFSNHQIKGIFRKILAFIQTPFSITGYFKVKAAISRFKPDVVHVHNYFPLISPSVFFLCGRMKTPVVHTLHNYRPICPTAFLMYDGKVETRSITSGPWWAVSKGVYKGSVVGTCCLAIMISLHKRLGTWQNKVNLFVALTEFSRDLYIRAGWPGDKIVVKPNFCTGGQEKLNAGAQPYALFVGRLSEEKGLPFIMKAWQSIDYPLVVVGTGPLQGYVQSIQNSQVTYLGQKSKEEVAQLMSGASFLIMASTCFEGLPMVLVEAFSCGTCAVVPRLGGMAEVVDDEETGLYYEPDSVSDFIEKVTLLCQAPRLSTELGKNAKKKFLRCYNSETNLRRLEEIYLKAQDQSTG